MLHETHRDPSIPEPLEAALPRPSWEDFNQLRGLSVLNNRYLALRHGKSEANALGIHSGDQAIGAAKYGLVEEGKQQIKESVEAAIAAGLIGKDTIVYCSGFLRAKQSAEIACAALGVAISGIEHAIGERGAGEFEGRASPLEEKKLLLRTAREKDLEDPFHETFGFESPVNVLARTTGLIVELEKRHSGAAILLVSHHDAIQVLRAAFAKRHPGEAWDMPSLKNAALVELSLDA